MTTDPAPRCYWCGRSVPDVAAKGCGSEEFPGISQDSRNHLCDVYQQSVKRKPATIP